MTNNTFPELDGWDEINHTHLTDKNIVSSIKATQKLVLSLVNLRSSISSQVGYLQNKVERLQKSIDSFSNDTKNSIDDFNHASSRLYKSSILLTAIIAYATLMNVIVSLVFPRNVVAIIAVIALILFGLLVKYLLKNL